MANANYKRIQKIRRHIHGELEITEGDETFNFLMNCQSAWAFMIENNFQKSLAVKHLMDTIPDCKSSWAYQIVAAAEECFGKLVKHNKYVERYRLIEQSGSRLSAHNKIMEEYISEDNIKSFDPTEWAKLVSAEAKLIDTHMKLTGADKHEQDVVDPMEFDGVTVLLVADDVAKKKAVEIHEKQNIKELGGLFESEYTDYEDV